MRNYIEVNVDTSVDIDIDDIIDQIETDDLVEELKKRQELPKNTPAIRDILPVSQIIEWFESPFVSDFDKMQVLNMVKDDLILEIDFIKSNL